MKDCIYRKSHQILIFSTEYSSDYELLSLLVQSDISSIHGLRSHYGIEEYSVMILFHQNRPPGRRESAYIANDRNRVYSVLRVFYIAKSKGCI